MSILGTLKTDNSINEDGDRLGGGFSPLDSAIYDLNIKLAYVTKAPSEAMALNVLFETDGKDVRQQFWMTSGKAKGCKNFYIKKDKTTDKETKHYLPGFNMANALCLLTVAKEISVMTTEEKVINLYDPNQQKEVPTKVNMVTELLGQTITGGVIKQIVDKKTKDAGTGEYQPTGETRIENEVDKFFRQRDGLTVTEIRAKMTEAQFKDQWEKKWTGETEDKSTGTGAVSGAPTPGAAIGAGGGAAASNKSLFS